ncbi:MAG: thioredoxin [Gammaproteobacteria bacterium]|nr:MAG: thioredoxin [Gammaproteobacteria bacterium]RLA15299.1 MAG: thioredoxin [Gammaproteobacteria bacterium]
MADTNTDFELDVIEASRRLPVVVDFWAEWCGPCKSLGPVLEKMAAAATDQWSLVKIDVDADQESAARYQVRSIPAVMLFVDGVVIAQFTGALPQSEVQAWLTANLPTASARQLLVIEELLQAGEFSAAIPLLEELVADYPELLAASIYLAQRQMFSDPTAALEWVADARLGDNLFDRVVDIRHIGALLQRDDESFAASKVRDDYLQAIAALREQQVETALEGFIKTLMFDPGYDDDGARKSCIALLNWMGEADSRVRGFRQKMQRALN